jgi:tetratricopeptide (TPR) repeat protein
MGMRERLLAQVRARLERFAADRSPATVLGPEAVAEVRALLATVADPTSDLEIAHTAGWMHWTRYQLLPPGADQQDLATALALFSPVYRARPDGVPDHLRGIFAEQRRGTAVTPAMWADRASELLHETMRTGSRPALDEAIDLLRQAVDATPTGHPDRSKYLSNLGFVLRSRFERTGGVADLDTAISVGQAAVDATPAGHPHRAGMLANVGLALRLQFRQTGWIADLDRAISTLQAAVDATPPDHSDRARYLTSLGNALQTRFERTGQMADLDAAISVGEAAVDATPPDHPDHARYLSNVGNALRIRFERTEQMSDLDRAISAGQAAVDGTPPGQPDRIAMLSNLGLALRARFRQTGQVSDLDRAISAGQAAVDGTPPGHPDHVRCLAVLGALLQARFERIGQMSDLDAAISTVQAAVDATPPGYPHHAGMLASLSLNLQARFGRTGQMADLDTAISTGQAAIDITPPSHPSRASALASIGYALQARFGRTGQVPDLDAAISSIQAAMDTSAAEQTDRAGYLASLSGALQTRFVRTGQMSDLDAAISTGQAAVDATPPGHPDHARNLANLGGALRLRFERTGQIADLDAAISASQAAVDGIPSDQPSRAGWLSNHGVALRLRFERTGQMTDLDAAISTGQAAVDATPLDHPDRAGWLSNLGAGLRLRFERTGQMTDLDAAISTIQAAVDATPSDHPSRVRWLANLSLALENRFARTGQITDLDTAISVGQAAADATPPDHPDRAVILSNLGGSLQTRFARTGQTADLDLAISVCRAAVDATPPDHPDRAKCLSHLGDSLRTRFERTGQAADLNMAIEILKAAAAVVGASPRLRAGAAHAWGLTAASGGYWQEAVAGFTTAVNLIGQVAPRSLTRADQEHLLATFGGLGADAASCCVQAGMIDQAVELFEQGRGVLLGQALDTRTDLTVLTEQHPDLAASFTGLRDLLDRADDSAMPEQPHPDTAGGDRRAAGIAFENLIASIRKLDEFETFLQPPPASDLLATASDGPVVAIASSRFGSYALLLTPGEVQAVALPELSPQTVSDQVIAFLDALTDITSTTAQEELAGILGWLWDVLAGPVLDRLGLTISPADGERWPRVWWCTSGLLSFLPVHAAGHHHTRFDSNPATVLDRVISSYTPTVRALAHARVTGNPQPVSLDGGRLLTVAMAHTPGASDLPGAQTEIAAIETCFPGQIDMLSGAQATRQTVLSRLPSARWAHFACHGAANLADPSQGQLLLTDQPLTVLDISRLRLSDAQLAFLSACETAMPGGRLTDEAIHLASAFQLAGFRHVIATLWPINDSHAVELADSVYTALADGADPPTAVHQAVRKLRAYRPRSPSVWASHLHAGA